MGILKMKIVNALTSKFGTFTPQILLTVLKHSRSALNRFQKRKKKLKQQLLQLKKLKTNNLVMHVFFKKYPS